MMHMSGSNALYMKDYESTQPNLHHVALSSSLSFTHTHTHTHSLTFAYRHNLHASHLLPVSAPVSKPEITLVDGAVCLLATC